MKFLRYICLILLVLASAGAKPSLTQADHQAWDSILKEFVDADSRVGYARLKSEAAPRLARYTDQLAAAEGSDWNSPEGKALLINAYNTFKSIAESLKSNPWLRLKFRSIYYFSSLYKG